MSIKPFSILALALAGLAAIGCGNTDGADGGPQPSKDPQTRVGDATKGVESSNMTPDQKQAAARYLNQGAASAEQIKKSAQAGGAPN